MSDATLQTPPAEPAAPGTPGSPPAAPAGSASPATRPEWLPEAHWDTQSNGIKPEFGAHYSELATFHKTQTEAQAALAARKAEDIKIEVKLPDTVKVPKGMKITIDEKDPRIPILRDIAVKNGLTQDTVNALVAFDAQMQIEAHTAEMTRLAAEDKKLGDNVKGRKEAVTNWAKGLKDRGDITAEEFEELALTIAGNAAGVTLLEKLMAKASGSVPANGGIAPPPPPPQKSLAERIWPDGFSQKKAS